MPLYRNVSSPYERAVGQGGQIATGPSQGADTVTTTKGQSKASQSLQMGMAGFDAFGQGNAVAGAIGSSIGPLYAPGASLGYDAGKGAANPWEAFIAGGVSANKNGMLPVNKNGGFNPTHLIPQDPVNNFVAGGLSGIGGFLF